jgi:serine/threonine-protein kinase HipA
MTMTASKKNKCLICYADLAEADASYHAGCCRKLFGKTKEPVLDYDLQDMEALAEKEIQNRFAVTGVQRKISLELGKPSRKKNAIMRLTIVGLWGGYILKPPTLDYPFMPEIEDLTMHLAGICGITTAEHGLIRLRSGELAYIARRFDRLDGQKLAVEDFCQLSERLTEDKYHSSMEKAGDVILNRSANPILDTGRFLDVAIHSYITGNADMHLKNFSLVTELDGTIHLAPAYDLLSTKLLVQEDREELALPINGKKNNLRREDFENLGIRLGIQPRAIENTFRRFEGKISPMYEMVGRSFVPSGMQSRLVDLIKTRCERIDIPLPD